MKVKKIFFCISCFLLVIVLSGCGTPSRQAQNEAAKNISSIISKLYNDTSYDMKRGVRYIQEIYITISNGDCTVSAFDAENFGNNARGVKSSGKAGTGNRLQDPSEANDLETKFAIMLANELGNETLSAYAICSNGGERIFIACAKGRSGKLSVGVDCPKVERTDSGIVVPIFDYPDDVGIYKSEALR